MSFGKNVDIFYVHSISIKQWTEFSQQSFNTCAVTVAINIVASVQTKTIIIWLDGANYL